MTLDPAALESLRELGGDEFVGELVDTFLADAPALLSALHGTDVAEVRRAAHTLKSNGLTLGAAGFAEACAELEELARTGDISGAGALVERVDHSYAELGEALGPFRQG
jgi:HPt (histidine-containing phosphotransfer) domain-containing protein